MAGIDCYVRIQPFQLLERQAHIFLSAFFEISAAYTPLEKGVAAEHNLFLLFDIAHSSVGVSRGPENLEGEACITDFVTVADIAERHVVHWEILHIEKVCISGKLRQQIAVGGIHYRRNVPFLSEVRHRKDVVEMCVRKQDARRPESLFFQILVYPRSLAAVLTTRIHYHTFSPFGRNHIKAFPEGIDIKSFYLAHFRHFV